MIGSQWQVWIIFGDYRWVIFGNDRYPRTGGSHLGITGTQEQVDHIWGLQVAKNSWIIFGDDRQPMAGVDHI